jgi:PAP2 superfamily
VSFWGVAAGAYGLVLAFAAITQPIARRPVAVTATLAYALVGVGAATLSNFWANLFIPGGLLLAGYWLSGMFFRAPQAWLEQWLLASDLTIGADRWLARTPRWIAELLEASYAADYVVIGGGAIFAATAGVDAVAYYWSLVLTSELACYVMLPWLRSRPPRVLEGDRGPRPSGRSLRRLNAAILDRASVQANTIPSGHVAGAVAAALGVMPIAATVGWGVMAAAGLIAIAAAAGRYHYFVDCAAGVAVALLAWSLI